MLTDMDNDFQFKQVPHGWALCYVEACKHREECMRYQMCLKAPKGTTRANCVLPTVLLEADCPHFHPIRKIRMARGFRRLFDEVKAKHRTVMRAQLATYLGSGGTYYRYRNGENPLSPEQQAWIERLFRRYGYTEKVVFDQYEEVYHCQF